MITSVFQRQMIALLPKYCLAEKQLKQVKCLEVGAGIDGEDTRIKILIAVEQVTSNVVAFCRAVVSKSGG